MRFISCRDPFVDNNFIHAYIKKDGTWEIHDDVDKLRDAQESDDSVKILYCGTHGIVQLGPSSVRQTVRPGSLPAAIPPLPPPPSFLQFILLQAA